MAVAKIQGRGKPAKTEQSKVKGRSRPGVRTSGGAALLPKPSVHRTGPGGRKTYKKRSQGFSLSLSLSLSLSFPHVSTLFLSLCLSPARWALFSSRLWIDVPSHREDGFSCCYLNKRSCNTDLFKSYNTVCPRPESPDPLRGL